MSAFDGNRDGYFDAAEIADANEVRFADVNRDGALNFNEFARVENPNKFAMYDTNRDGLVDTPEYARGELNTEHRYGF
ncbi:unnamed protein product [Adineta ricciae]|uniref:EF-hand domain-containing protein n=1 Tax=Adineta ricciae TaxID=249248 RepID=A0A815GZP0_ADIRI|nr:unnamed protein product [Adineta ricciae]